VTKPKEYPAQSYCGCCGRQIASGFFCAACGPHLRGSNLPPEERTFFAQHQKPCPLAVDLCPRCGEPLEFDEVDVGVGVIRGNPGCPACHWVSDQKPEPEEEIRVLLKCPQCGAEQEDLDGFGVVACSACGYCTHPSRTDDICGICGKRVRQCRECGGRGALDGHAGIDHGAECSACEGTGIIVEEVQGGGEAVS
jgi:hypothetical protein